MSKISKWPSLRPLALKNDFYDGLNLKKNEKIGIEKVVEEKDFALQQHFP